MARYADASNLFASWPSDVGTKLDVLRRECQVDGTDCDRIEKTILWVGSAPRATRDDARHFVDVVAPYAALGISQVVVMPIGQDPLVRVRTLGEHVVPRRASIEA